ncbi:Protein rad9 [Grifola frondosa]|uniref:Protein rad9 n=1 Tax=Grifola frondosa TaxID=5627 RepID=A0A1C7M8M4_GRIFR|nr:Protein rad9 [Grifola frondosa]
MSRSNLYHPQESPHRQTYHPSPNASLTRVAADSVQDAHRLFASYPFASATPSTHVTRHLGHLSIAAPPSYVQPYIYGAQAAPHSPTYFPQYSEFANELNHISSSSIPMHDGGYWERSRNEAVRYLGDQGSSYPYYQSPNQWSQLYQHSSTYQSNPFAQSMFQHSAPAASYPTPPPPGIAMSSSSLAYALGEPVPKPARTIYQPEDSAIFFNTFLTQTATELDVSRHASDNTQLTPPRPNVLSKEDDSPDPLALVHSGPQANQPTSRKRRGDCYLESPSVKRVQVAEPSRNLLTPHRSGTETKPSSPSSFKTTPTSTKKLQAYVDVPPLPKSYMTPTSSRRDRSGLRTLSGNNTGKRKVQEDDDLGGFGSEDDDNYPRMPLDFGNSVKSSSRRTTGERDGRAPLEKFMTLLEDIFEAEDSLSPDIDVHDLPAEFFSPLTTDGSRPLLQPSVIRKLMNCITKVARPSKRVRLSSREVNNGIAGTPRPKGRIAEVDTNILSRILKLWSGVSGLVTI